MKRYIFSVAKGARAHPGDGRRQKWNGLNLSEAAALYGATDTLDAILDLRDGDDHCIPLVRRVDGLDMLCSDYRRHDRWKDGPMLHIYIVPWLVETLSLRLEYDRDDIQGIVFDRFFYLTSGRRIEDCSVSAFANLDIPAVRDRDIDWLIRALVKNMSVRLSHDLHGLCVVQHLGGDYAFRVYGDQIAPCDAIKPID